MPLVSKQYQLLNQRKSENLSFMINTVIHLPELFSARKAMQGSVGIVPTMGYLHQGHLSLIERSMQENTNTIVTIFVNPTQFGPNEDLAKYPRDVQGDLSKIDSLGNVLVWMPESADMYPDGFQTWVNVSELTKPLEGEMRPGHFQGVTTIVAKLFNAVRPDVAYFGQKDVQQATVIRQMTNDLSYPIRIEVCPTVREPDGLAMSSRNAYLQQSERTAAPVLYKALSMAREAYQQGERDATCLSALVSNVISKEPLAQVQYVQCSNKRTLKPCEGKIVDGAIISLAVYFGKTRLIDNIILE